MITIYLSKKSKKPYYEQIYEYIKNEIKKGRLKHREKLPSSRALAQHLNVSRSTVDTAYSQLVAEGYIEVYPKKGYFVSEIDEILNMVPISFPPVAEEKKKIVKCDYDFAPNGADAMNFPDVYWRKLTKECINYDDGTVFQSSEPQGDYGLREALCSYLRQNRGVMTNPNNIVIGAGSQYLMMLLVQLLKTGSSIAMENPVYMASYKTFCSLKKEVIPISVDEAGMNVDDLKQSGADIAYVTPSHQYPLGMVMPVSRRTQLLNWANHEPERYIIEDDYDSEFRYLGKPIPALQSMDKGKKVVYMGSFSKVVSPAIRMSYMVLPDSLLSRYQNLFSTFPSTVSRLDQSIMTKFINEGYFERHVNRLRKHYRIRHEVLLKELKQFKDKVRLSGINAGSYVVMQWLGSMSEEELIESAEQHGIMMYPLKNYMIIPCFRMYPTFLMGFAQLSEEDIKNSIAILRQIWK